VERVLGGDCRAELASAGRVPKTRKVAALRARRLWRKVMGTPRRSRGGDVGRGLRGRSWTPGSRLRLRGSTRAHTQECLQQCLTAQRAYRMCKGFGAFGCGKPGLDQLRIQGCAKFGMAGEGFTGGRWRLGARALGKAEGVGNGGNHTYATKHSRRKELSAIHRNSPRTRDLVCARSSYCFNCYSDTPQASCAQAWKSGHFQARVGDRGPVSVRKPQEAWIRVGRNATMSPSA